MGQWTSSSSPQEDQPQPQSQQSTPHKLLPQTPQRRPTRQSSSRRRSFRSPFRRPTRTLSATFNFIDSRTKTSQVNVNLATEEELMTLPGINRSLARSIVEYRNVIGRFNKIEDLALVSGVGAQRLDLIRPEICVTRRKLASCASSATQSIDSLDGELSHYHPTLVDVNTATLFDLMAVQGISQELAATIIDYRDRKGDFFTLNDLVKVKGMNQTKLDLYRPFLTIKSDSKSYHILNGRTPASEPLGRRMNKSKSMTCSPPRSVSRQTMPQSVSISSNHNINNNNNYDNNNSNINNNNNRSHHCDLGGSKQLYEAVSSASPRPAVHSPPLDPDQLRIASWHVTDLCRSKVENTAVREVFCLTLLENRISLVALQGVEDSQCLRMLCEEMLSPTCNRLVKWKNRGIWAAHFVPMKTNNGVYNLGFMYNTQELRQILVKVVQDNSMMLAAEAVISYSGAIIDVLNVHLMSNSCSASLTTLLDTLKPSIVLGDLTLAKSGQISDSTEGLVKYTAVVKTSSSVESNSGKYDNIHFRRGTDTRFTGDCGVILRGLHHLAIPKGWSWNGPVSDRAPVWVTLDMSEDNDGTG